MLVIIAARAITRFWFTVVMLIIAGLGYLANKLTRGRTIEYLQYQMNERMKNTLLTIHGIASLILALALPNHYLNRVEQIRTLYNENDLWIAASVLALLFFFLMMF